jgi:N-acetylglucosamine kinase-like BadF-type ATPase
MAEPDLLLAVDGGGTRTRSAVADLEGRILARGFGGNSNIQIRSLAEVGEALTTAIEGAILQIPGGQWKGDGAAWRSGRIAAACFGLAGVDTKEDEAKVSGWVRDQAVARRFSVLNDSELVLACGTPEGVGVALISGTGSICLGRTVDGRTYRVGGWGPLTGDEGSAYDLAARALHLVTKTADGRAQAKGLVRAALTHFSQPDVPALVHLLHASSTTSTDVAGLSTTVLDLAARGDAVAAALVDTAAAELVEQVQVVLRTLGLEKPPFAMAGGMLRSHLKTLLLARLGGQLGQVTHVTDPILGAIALAKRLMKG